jgi:hypothetical protein
MMLRRLALKTQRKTQLVDSAINNTTAGIHRNSETGYNILNAMYRTMRSALVESACREVLKYRMWSVYVTIRRLYTYNQI